MSCSLHLTALDGHIQLLTIRARFPSLIFTAPAITEMYTANDATLCTYMRLLLAPMSTAECLN